VKSRISGKEAVYVARESERRRPVKLLVSRSVHASTINAWHLRPIWRATEHAYVKPSANSCRMSSSTFAERCLACGGREYGYDPLLPYGVEPTGHAWPHSRCWEAWHAARKREAAAALKAMGVGKPTATE
jgi:hypothetical protein